MKKILSLMLIVLLLFGCTANKSNPELAQNEPETKQENFLISSDVNTYYLETELKDNILNCTMRVNYVNKQEFALDYIYFNLYPNLYKDKSNIDPSSLNKIYPNGFNEGSLDISNVTYKDQELTLSYENSQKLVKVDLPSSLACLENIMLSFNFTVTLPNSLSRLGYNNGCYNLTSFYPVACVIEDKQFVKSDYNYIGDPFFTDISDHYISLNLPSKYTVASSGNATITNNGDTQNIKITGKNLREMAIVASDSFNLYSDTIDGITVNSYAKEEIYGQKALDTAKKAISTFNDAFGKYPYQQISIVESEYYGGGMEYPNLVIITQDVYNQVGLNEFSLEWIVAHEVGHQWWYGVVGNDPTLDAFLDEALTEYSTLLYAKKNYDESTYQKLKNTYILSPYTKYEHLLTTKEIHKPSKDYLSNLEFSMVVYIRGTMMYLEMEKIMGEEKLLATLKEYYSKNSYGIVTVEQYIDHFKQSYDYKWDTFFNKWLYNK